MDKKAALEYLEIFLDKNPDFKPNENFMLKEPYEYTIDGNKIYFVIWTDLDGQNARGGATYYIFPDGAVLMPHGGSGHPETLEDVYSRWQRQK